MNSDQSEPTMPRMALRNDSTGELDDVVVVEPSMFRAEMMSEGVLWMACYFPDDDSDGVVFHVSARKKGVLDFSLSATPAQWHDIDTDPREPLGPSRIDLSVLLQQAPWFPRIAAGPHHRVGRGEEVKMERMAFMPTAPGPVIAEAVAKAIWDDEQEFMGIGASWDLCDLDTRNEYMVRAHAAIHAYEVAKHSATGACVCWSNMPPRDECPVHGRQGRGQQDG